MNVLSFCLRFSSSRRSSSDGCARSFGCGHKGRQGIICRRDHVGGFQRLEQGQGASLFSKVNAYKRRNTRVLKQTTWRTGHARSNTASKIQRFAVTTKPSGVQSSAASALQDASAQYNTLPQKQATHPAATNVVRHGAPKNSPKETKSAVDP